MYIYIYIYLSESPSPFTRSSFPAPEHTEGCQSSPRTPLIGNPSPLVNENFLTTH